MRQAIILARLLGADALGAQGYTRTAGDTVGALTGSATDLLHRPLAMRVDARGERRSSACRP